MTGYLTIKEAAERLNQPHHAFKCRVLRLEKRGFGLFLGRPKRIPESKLPELAVRLGLAEEVVVGVAVDSAIRSALNELALRLDRLELELE